MSRFDLENALRRADQDQTGYIPRDVLDVLAQESVKSCYHRPVPKQDLSSLLDACLLSSEDQVSRQDWLGERERSQNLGKVPIPQYDAKRYTDAVVDLISFKDTDLFV